MKRSDLVLVYLALLTLWLPGSSQAQNPITGTGYPTSMVPCCLKPPSPFPVPGVRIFNKHRKAILTLEPPSTDGPFEMYFSIPIATLQNKCGGLLPGNFEIGYDFLDNNTLAYGTDMRAKGTLQSFSVSILKPAAQAVVVDPQGLPLRTAKKVQPQVVYSHIMFPASANKGITYPLIETGQGRYRLAGQAAPYFVVGNTLTLHATGFNNIYLGVRCSKPK